MKETDEFTRTCIGCKLVILGVSIGINAHTVGTDAVMNMKGSAGHYDLKRYDMTNAYNLGGQMLNEELIAKGIEVNADTPLVSWTVTQKNIHIKNMTEFIELVEAEGLHGKMIIICGGPRIPHELARELGFDAGFGTNTFADDVASFVRQRIIRRKETAEGK